MPNTFYLETFGCTANTAASELMSYLLLEGGFKKTASSKQADVIILNTCIVKTPTESKIKTLLQRTYQTDKPLVIVGCLPQVFSDWCQEHLPKAVLLGVDHYHNIQAAVTAALTSQPFIQISRQKSFSLTTHRDRRRAVTAIIELSKGCSGICTYCIVRIAKGPLVSKPVSLILAEAKKAVQDHCKELWLTAQDTASYGKDTNSSLPSIVEKIAAIEGEFMIRVGMMNADIALPQVVALKKMYAHSKVYTFAHIPLQSGSNKVLQKMKRKYTIEEFELLVSELRKSNQITLSTDIIAGFPGETDQDHQLTLSVLKELKPDVVNISKYGDRPGTIASRSREKNPSEIVKARSTEISQLVAQLALEANQKWIGWEGPALALSCEESTGAILFRNKAYKLIECSAPFIEIGKFYRLKIIGAQKTRLIASLI